MNSYIARYFGVVLTIAILTQAAVLAQDYDLVINGGRVIDPETKLDAVRHVGIKAGKIAAISEQPLAGKKTIDATGLIVSPGFIDYHSHAQSIPSDRMQAFDGVTTTLETESGIILFPQWLEKQKKTGRVLNYGATAAWTFARVVALENIKPVLTVEWVQSTYGLRKWVNNVSTDAEQKVILDTLERELNAGALGIGCNVGYAPGYGYKEMLAVHQLAAKHNVPTFTHIRYMSNIDPNSSVQAYGELISYSMATGAHVHICHLNSTSVRDVGLAARVVDDARKRGTRVTVEAYPYGAGSSAVGAVIFDRENLKRMGMTVADMEFQGKPLTDELYDKLRKETPGEFIVFHFFRLPRDRELLDQAVLFPGGIIASDGMPWTDTKTNKTIEEDVWPLPATAFSHPRSAATFVRYLIDYVRDTKKETLSEGIARCSYRPARLLEASVPSLKKKGRLQVGMDADVSIFDLASLQVRSTFTEPNQHTLGMKHVIVNGVPVIENGILDTKAFPGQVVKR